MRFLNQPFFPLLLAIFPVVFLYAHNQQHFLIGVVLLPIAASLLVALLCIAVFYGLFRNLRKAALMTGVCYGLLILYNPLFEWWEAVRIETAFLVIGPLKIIAVLAIFVIVGSFVVLLRTKLPLTNPTIVMNVVSLTMLLPPVIDMVQYNWADSQGADPSIKGVAERLPIGRAGPPSATLPSIYHIVLDGYGRDDIYAEYFDFDNAGLRQFFADKGFLLSLTSRSNYTQTALSFASMLNGDYLQELLGDLDSRAGKDDRAAVFSLIRDNAVFATLAKAGYRIQSYDSGYFGTDFSGTSVKTLSPNHAGLLGFGFLDEFQSEFLNLTPLPRILTLVVGHDRFSNFAIRRERIEFAFDNMGKPWTLGEGAGRNFSPTYNLVHILGPHGPHLDRADGKSFNPTEAKATGDSCAIIGEGGVTPGVYIERHVNYVQYLNQRLMQAIERILQIHEQRVIILVTSDHGPGSSCEADNLLKPAYLRERTANLLALYLPDREKGAAFLSQTPVNLYRLLFNQYLGADLPLLPNKVFFSSSERPFALVDVIAMTTQECRSDRRGTDEAYHTVCQAEE